MSHRRAIEDSRRLKRLYDESKHWMRGGAYYSEKKKRYIRYTWNKNGLTKYLRRCGHRQLRRMREPYLLQRAGYRRLFDYWWTLY